MGILRAGRLVGAIALLAASATPGCTTSTPTTPVDPCARVPAILAPAVTSSSVVAPVPATRFFSDTASWNRPVSYFGRSTALDSYADRLWTYGGDEACPGSTHVSFRNDSVPIYDRSQATTTAQLFQDPGYSSQTTMGDLPLGATIPWNLNWQASNGFDKTLTIVDYVSGEAWEIWVKLPSHDSCGLRVENVTAGFDKNDVTDLCIASVRHYTDLFTATDSSSIGIRGCGLRKLALTVRADEVLSGTIRHAIPLTVANPMFGPMATPDNTYTGVGAGTTTGFYLRPATRLEHADPTTLGLGGVTTHPATDTYRAQSLPSGMRFAITITDAEIATWLDARGFTGAKRSTARTFAVALRDYGGIVAETGGYGIGIETDGLVNPESANKWAAAGISGGKDDNSDAPGNLLDGLLTQDRLYVVNPPSGT